MSVFTTFSIKVAHCCSRWGGWILKIACLPDNNKAETVLNLFKGAVSTYGLPSRVRCDKGDENYDGWFMLHNPDRGSGRGSVLAGINAVIFFNSYHVRYVKLLFI